MITAAPKIAYLVHDVGDAAVSRRVRMFHAGDAKVRVAGFRRREQSADIDGALTADLGRTGDGRLAQRALAVLKVLVFRRVLKRAVAGSDVIVARKDESRMNALNELVASVAAGSVKLAGVVVNEF